MPCEDASEFDEMTERAHRITNVQLRKRKKIEDLLRAAMEAEGFKSRK